MMDQMETGESMEGESSNIKDLVKKVNDKDYDGKKEQIFEHLTKIKKELRLCVFHLSGAGQQRKLCRRWNRCFV